MADVSSNVTINLRIASQAQDRSDLQATAAGLDAVRVATHALTKEEAAREVVHRDLAMRQRQQGQVSQADEQRAQQQRNVQVQSARQQGVAPVEKTVQTSQQGATVLQQAWKDQQASIDRRRARLNMDLPGANDLAEGLDKEEAELRHRRRRVEQDETWQRQKATITTARAQMFPTLPGTARVEPPAPAATPPVPPWQRLQQEWQPPRPSAPAVVTPAVTPAPTPEVSPREQIGRTRTERVAAWQERQMGAGPLTTRPPEGDAAPATGLTPGGMSPGTYRGLQVRQQAYTQQLDKIRAEMAGRHPLTNLRTWDLSKDEKAIQDRLAKVQATLAQPMAPPAGGEEPAAKPAPGGRPPRRPAVPPPPSPGEEEEIPGAGYRPGRVAGQLGMRALGTGLGMVGLGGTFTGLSMEFGRQLGGSFGARVGGGGGGQVPSPPVAPVAPPVAPPVVASVGPRVGPRVFMGGGAGMPVPSFTAGGAPSSIGGRIVQGASTGAMLGGAGGSVVPGVGTGIGAGVGAFVGALGGLLAGLVVDKVIDKTTQALGRYEERVRTAGRLTQYLAMPYEEMDETIEHMRVNQHAMAADTLSAMQGISRYVGKVDQGMTETALRTARAFGVSEEQAGEMVGQMARYMTPGGRPSNLASFQQKRPYAGIADAQFIEQSIGIAAAGGVDMPAMTPSYAGRMANFIGGMGQRFPGQQAQVFQQLQAGQTGSMSGIEGMIRYRAINNLRKKLKGGILRIGDEDIDLNTLRGQRQALEQASQSGAVMEEIASESERLGTGVPGLGEELIQRTLMPGSSVFRSKQFMAERNRRRGRGGLRTLDEPGDAGIGKEMEDLLIKGMSPQYEKLLVANAGVEQALEKTVKELFATKTDLTQALANAGNAGPIQTIAEWLTGNRSTFDGIGTALTGINNFLSQVGATPGGAAPGAPTPPAGSPINWVPPPDPRVQPQRTL